MQSLLFITWDSDQTNYLETLFFPILKGIQIKGRFHCHVIQFSWARRGEVTKIRKMADELDIQYTHFRIHKNPSAMLGTILAVYKGVFYIKRYIQKNGINTVMPRSTMPAMMINRLKSWLSNNKIKVVFDADGHPLEERVDYTDLKSGNWKYKLMKREEISILQNADVVLTRSKKAIIYHLDNIGNRHRDKFFKVSNGRPIEKFRLSPFFRNDHRLKFGLDPEDLLFVYSGSIGPQYCLEEMIRIFETYHLKFPKSKFLILTLQKRHLENIIPPKLKNSILCNSCNFDKIPEYLSAADVAFSLRRPAPSLSGISPIKFGEYLMMGLPVIASSGVGDSEELLEGKDFCFIYHQQDSEREAKVLDWIQGLSHLKKERIAEFGEAHFSLDKSVDEYLQALE